MSRESALARGRAAAEISMVDACTIRRITGSVSDDFSGVPVQTWADLYAGKCRVQQALAQSQQHTVGEDYQLLLRLEVQLPTSVVGVEIGDVVTITSAAHEPDLPGRVFLVRDLAHKTDATARRIQVTERTD